MEILHKNEKEIDAPIYEYNLKNKSNDWIIGKKKWDAGDIWQDAINKGDSFDDSPEFVPKYKSLVSTFNGNLSIFKKPEILNSFDPDQYGKVMYVQSNCQEELAFKKYENGKNIYYTVYMEKGEIKLAEKINSNLVGENILKTEKYFHNEAFQKFTKAEKLESIFEYIKKH